MPKTMDETTREAILRLIDREGGESDDAVDHGGHTKFGITLPYLSRFLGRPATDVELSGLDKDAACAVYFHNTWLGEHLDTLSKYPLLQEFVFDWCVNAGDNTGSMALQHQLGVVEDGDIGLHTLDALDTWMHAHGKYAEQRLVNQMVLYRCKFYCRLVGRDASQAKFIWGWINRALGFQQFNFG